MGVDGPVKVSIVSVTVCHCQSIVPASLARCCVPHAALAAAAGQWWNLILSSREHETVLGCKYEVIDSSRMWLVVDAPGGSRRWMGRLQILFWYVDGLLWEEQMRKKGESDGRCKWVYDRQSLEQNQGWLGI